MFDASLIDWTKLQSPTKRTKLMVSKGRDDFEFIKKVTEFGNRLLKDFLYLQDEYRNDGAVQAILQGFFSGNKVNLCYEMGDFQGIVGFTGIMPEYKCGVFLKIWDKELHGKELIRELQELSDIIMDTFKLRRMTVDTPDRRMVKFAQLAGFKVEGTQKLCFRWNDKLHTNYILSKLYEPDKKSEEKEGGK